MICPGDGTLFLVPPGLGDYADDLKIEIVSINMRISKVFSGIHGERTYKDGGCLMWRRSRWGDHGRVQIMRITDADVKSFNTSCDFLGAKRKY